MEAGINKSVVAELFGVSRSAVTQSMKNRTIEQDLKIRITKYILPNDMKQAQADGTVFALVVRKAERLTKKAEMLLNRRIKKAEANKYLGRPAILPDIGVFRIIIQDVIDMLGDSVKKTMKPDFTALAFHMLRFTYRCLGVRNLRWRPELNPPPIFEDEEEFLENEEVNFDTKNSLVNSDTQTEAQIISEPGCYWDGWSVAQKIACMMTVPDPTAYQIKSIYDCGMFREQDVHWIALLPKSCPEGHPVLNA